MEDGRMSLAAVKAVLFDLNGTLHVGSEAIGGAVEALSRLSRAGIPVRFVSNTSKESRKSLLHRLHQAGLSPWVSDSTLFTSLSATVSEVQERGLSNPLLFLSASSLEDFHAHGIVPSDDRPYDCVVVGLAPETFHYDRLNLAFSVLSSAGSPPLIAAHKGRYLAKEDGSIALGPGGFVTALEYSAGVQAVVVGKPCEQFFDRAVKSFGDAQLHKCQVAMVGDDVRDDALAAKALGFYSVLVKTGKYAQGDECKFGDTPHFVTQDVNSFVDALLAAKQLS